MNIFGESIGIMVVGIVVVFLGLFILVVTIGIMSSLFKSFKNKDNKSNNTIATVANEAKNVLEKVAPISASDPTVSPDVLAAITAAITFCLGSDNKFIVRKIKRTTRKF